MFRRLQPRIRSWRHSLEEVAQSGQIRRAQVSFGAIWASESAFMVGLGVVAFRAGGVGAVGIVTGARMAAAALLAPLLATVADRVRREHVLTGVGLVRAVALGTAAAVTAAGGPAAVFAACAAAALLAGLLVVALPYDAPPRTEAATRAGMLQGFATIAADRGLTLITALGVVQ